jgi:hypothetical protein
MNGSDFKTFVIRVFRSPWIRGLLYYSLLLLGSFCLFAGISLIVRDGEEYRLIGWGYTVLGSIAMVSIIKFQGWFFPKTENAELKQPTNVIARFAHTARSILLLIVFYFTHFSFIHRVRWVNLDGNETLHEWCPFGEHTYHLSEEMFGYIIFVPLALSLLSTIVFNHSNRIVRVVLFLLPVVGVVFFLFLSTRYSDEINEKAQKSMSEAERKEYE